MKSNKTRVYSKQERHVISIPPNKSEETLKKLSKPIDIERMEKLANIITQTAETVDEVELIVGYLRYEALRKLKPNEVLELHAKNLKGANFDAMIDDLIVKGELK